MTEKNVAADGHVAESIMRMRAAGLPDDEIGHALLIGAFSVARGCVDPLDWARCLEKGAAVIRANPVSTEKH